MLCWTFILVVCAIIPYLVREYGGQHCVVGRRNDEVVVEVVVIVRLDHLTRARLGSRSYTKSILRLSECSSTEELRTWV